MRKELTLLLSATMIFGLTACNVKPAGDTKAKDEDDVVTEAVSGDEETEKTAEATDGGASADFIPYRQRVASGGSGDAVLLNNGTVVSSLGTSTDAGVEVHDEWKSWTNIVSISMNEELLAGLKSDGTVVWCGGRTLDYDWLKDPEIMGVVDKWTGVAQIATSCCDIAALMNDGSVEITGSIWTEDLEETKGFTQISVYEVFMALRRDGTVYLYDPYTREENNYDVSDWKDITQISCGFDHAVALRKDGTVVATGSNDSHQCDTGDWTDVVQVVAGRWHTIGLKSDGTLLFAGDDEYNFGAGFINEWTDIAEISGFFDSALAIKKDGTVLYYAIPDRWNPIGVDSIN